MRRLSARELVEWMAFYQLEEKERAEEEKKLNRNGA